MTPDSIPVVCAIIERDGLVLLAQRPPHKHLGGKWEFPGGKVESDETPASAIIREIREELGCSITDLRALPHNVHAYDHGTIEMIPFIARLETDKAAINLFEHTALVWCSSSALLDYDLAAADIPVVAAYRHTL